MPPLPRRYTPRPALTAHRAGNHFKAALPRGLMIPERVKSTFPREEQHRVLLGRALCSARLTVWPDLNPGVSLTAGHGSGEG